MVDVDVYVEDPGVVLQQLQYGDHDVVHVTKPTSLEFLKKKLKFGNCIISKRKKCLGVIVYYSFSIKKKYKKVLSKKHLFFHIYFSLLFYHYYYILII